MSKDKKNMLLIKAAALCLTGMVTLTGCASGPQEQTQPSEPAVTVPQVKYETVQTAQGTYARESKDSLKIVYLQEESLSWKGANARIQEVLVRRREEVKKGEVLIAFDIEGSEAELAALRLQLKRAKENRETGSARRAAALQQLRAEAETLESYDRQIALLQEQKQQAEYEQFLYQTGQEIAGLEEQIAVLEAEQQNNVLVAPFDGIISKVTALNPGDEVTAGQELVVIYSKEKLLLSCSNRNKDLRYNMPVTVSVDSDTFAGRVIAAPDILGASMPQSTVLIELDEKVTEGHLTGTKQVRYVSQEICDVLTVDRSAIKTEGELDYALVLNDDMVQKRYVTVKTNSSGTAWILDGLSEGDTLIVE